MKRDFNHKYNTKPEQRLECTRCCKSGITLLLEMIKENKILSIVVINVKKKMTSCKSVTNRLCSHNIIVKSLGVRNEKKKRHTWIPA